ncbi:hypothetical protein TYRP_007486 [Tyrophagus putrescentiae]|nr:hypothetical protein TYRP_007486 [Tyrophagus putrescentiae]
MKRMSSSSNLNSVRWSGRIAHALFGDSTALNHRLGVIYLLHLLLLRLRTVQRQQIGRVQVKSLLVEAATGGDAADPVAIEGAAVPVALALLDTAKGAVADCLLTVDNLHLNEVHRLLRSAVVQQLHPQDDVRLILDETALQLLLIAGVQGATSGALSASLSRARSGPLLLGGVAPSSPQSSAPLLGDAHHHVGVSVQRVLQQRKEALGELRRGHVGADAFAEVAGQVLQVLADGAAVQRLVAAVQLGEGLLQQTWPELAVLAVHAEELSVERRQAVVDDNVVPLAVLPQAKVEDARVVARLEGLLVGHHPAEAVPALPVQAAQGRGEVGAATATVHYVDLRSEVHGG